MQGQDSGLFQEENGLFHCHSTMRGRNARNRSTVRGSQTRQGQSSWRRSSVQKRTGEFVRGKSVEIWTGIRLEEKKKKPHCRLNDPFPSSYILLPEPERPAATTRQSLSGRRAPTSDSARQPDLTSWLGAKPCGISSGRRKLGVSPCAGSERANIPTAHALTGCDRAEVTGSGLGVGCVGGG